MSAFSANIHAAVRVSISISYNKRQTYDSQCSGESRKKNYFRRYLIHRVEQVVTTYLLKTHV